jgi:hypothetical protein
MTVPESSPGIVRFAHGSGSSRLSPRHRAVAYQLHSAELGKVKEHGFGEYAEWFLGEDDEANEETKGRYKFPYGDFERVHRCAVLSAESLAGQYKHIDIENAAAHLYEMLEALK